MRVLLFGFGLIASVAVATPRDDWRMEPHRHRIVEEEVAGARLLRLHGLKIYKDDVRDFDHSVPMTFSYRIGSGETKVDLGFLSTAPRWELREDHRLVLELDGRPLETGPVTYAGRTICVTVQEKLDLALSFSDLERLTGAREIRGRLGPFRFTLDDGHLQVLAEYLRRCRPGD